MKYQLFRQNAQNFSISLKITSMKCSFKGLKTQVRSILIIYWILVS